MNIRLINRIWSIYLPFCIIVIFYIIKRLDYPFDKFHEIDSLLILVFGFLIASIVQTIFFINRGKRRKNHLRIASSNKQMFIEMETYPKKLSYMNIKISINDKTIDVFDKLSFMFCADKIDKSIEVKSIFKNRIFSFYDIDSILFEFDNIYYYTLKSDWEKTIWLGSFSIVLKNNKIVHLFNFRSERDHLKEIGEYENIDTNENYYKIGLEILKIIVNELNMNYRIINYTKKPAANTVQIS